MSYLYIAHQNIQMPVFHNLLLILALAISCLFGFGGTNTAVSQEVSKPEKRSLSEPLSAEERKTPLDEYVSPSEIAKKAFDEPPGARRLSERNVWVDLKNQRVYADGYVAMTEGSLEMFACPAGTKEHESLVATLAKSSELHAAMLAVGAMSGTPVAYHPKYVPATGQRIRIWVCFYDENDKYQAIDARSWVQKIDNKTQLETDWVFVGSGFWKDPKTGREYYQADGGDMICVSNFSSAMMDLPISSSADADDLQYVPFTKRIAKRGTPVRLVMVPITLPADHPPTKAKADTKTPPGKEVLPRKVDGNPSKPVNNGQ